MGEEGIGELVEEEGQEAELAAEEELEAELPAEEAAEEAELVTSDSELVSEDAITELKEEEHEAEKLDDLSAEVVNETNLLRAHTASASASEESHEKFWGD